MRLSRLAVAALLPFGSAYADEADIGYGAIIAGIQSGNTFTGDFVFPAFDPSLGTLDSVSFSLNGMVTVISDLSNVKPANYSSYEVFSTVGTQTFLGFQRLVYSDDLGPPSVCAGPNECVGIWTDMFSDAFEGIGLFKGMLANSGAVGTTPFDLSVFEGISSMDLPISRTFVAYSAGPILSESVSWNAELEYNYTPADPPDPPPTVTPEPRWPAFLMLGLLIAPLPLQRRCK